MRREALLAAAFVVMSFNSLYQYSWNALEPLIAAGLRAPFIKVQLAFTLFAVASTLSQVVTGPIADKRGPRPIAVPAAALSALGFLGTWASRSLVEFYAFWTIGSTGEGILYGVASNVAVKWFPDRRGLATGLVSLGFGLGSSIADPLIMTYSSLGEVTLTIGIIELVALMSISAVLSYPQGRLKGAGTLTVIRSPRWWALYTSFAFALVPLVSYSSSMSELSYAGYGLEAAAISLFPLASGLGRPVLGSVSDRLGRVKTTLLALLADAAASAVAGLLRGPGALVGVVLVGLFGGALIPLYFAIVADLYGERMSTSNTAVLYTGKSLSGLLGGVALALMLSYVGRGAALIYVSTSPAIAAALLAVVGAEG